MKKKSGGCKEEGRGAGGGHGGSGVTLRRSSGVFAQTGISVPEEE